MTRSSIFITGITQKRKDRLCSSLEYLFKEMEEDLEINSFNDFTFGDWEQTFKEIKVSTS